LEQHVTRENPKVFVARAGKHGEDEEYALEQGVAIIGFSDFPSLEGAKDYNAVLRLVTTAQPDLKPRVAGAFAGQLWNFALGMEVGDIVVLPRKLTSQVALGKITGPYAYRQIGDTQRHTRPVQWIRPDVPRTAFGQDLLYSFGAFLTVFNVSRNDADRRVAAVLDGKADPGFVGETVRPKEAPPLPANRQPETATDLAQAAHDQIVAHIQSKFAGHSLARLVDAVLRADGWVTKLSPPGPDGGVDILAGRGTLGLDGPRLCVQVKSQSSPADVTVYRTLQGSMQSFDAEQGLLVCWGGFNRVVQSEARQSHFFVRLWESRELVEAIYRNYEKLPPEIQADLPLKRVWTLVREEEEE
jgi:restriction system protein